MERILDNRRFLSWLGLVFLATCTITAGFNYAVDPYALFNTARIEGFNARKPAAADRIRTSKPYMATAAKAHTK